MKDEQNERAKRIGWVSLVVGVAIISVSILASLAHLMHTVMTGTRYSAT